MWLAKRRQEFVLEFLAFGFPSYQDNKINSQFILFNYYLYKQRKKLLLLTNNVKNTCLYLLQYSTLSINIDHHFRFKNPNLLKLQQLYRHTDNQHPKLMTKPKSHFFTQNHTLPESRPCKMQI